MLCKYKQLIDKIFWYRVHKIKEVKYYARNKNLPVWYMPVIDSIMLCFLGSIYISDYIAEAMPSGGLFEVVSPYLPFIFFALAFMTVMDIVAKGMVNIHYFLIKLVHGGIQKLDYYLWKKTKRDNVVSNKIWAFQMKYSNLSKPTKRRIRILVVLLIILYMLIRFF